MRESLSEVLERINIIEDEAQRIQALHIAVNTLSRFKDVLYYAFSPKVEWDLPEGTPPFKESNEVNTHATIWGEIRRMYLFVKPNKLTDARRQQLFIELLEFLHPTDAHLICAIKDKNWPFDGITAEIVEQVAPGLLSETLLENGVRA